ncbi:MAG: ATP-binding protein, partial [Chloroflexota bacterium]
EDGRLRPTKAGILLFGKDPQRHIRNAEITAARFPGDSMSDSFKREDIVGTIPDQIRRAEAFLHDYLRKEVSIGRTMERTENFEYPLEAARELVVNAAAHRDYSISGDGIRLFIFRSRMEVTSPGGLPGPVTIDNIKDERFSRNPVIVQVLSDMGFIERLGYGVDRVIDLMHEKHLRAPEFEETAGGFRVCLHNDPILEKPALAQETPSDLFKLDGQYKGKPINSRQEAALIYLLRDGNNRITNSDLQTLCPDVHPETIRRDLADLVTKAILRKLGQKRGSYYVLSNS